MHSTPPPDTSLHFAALAAAVRPQWHDAILGLSWVSVRLDNIRECRDRQDFVSRCRSLIDTLIDVLDEIDPDPDLEEDDREEVGDDEPSLGSFDRMTDQDMSWRQRLRDIPEYDAEQDDCDSEDADPDEDKQQPPEMGGVA